MTHARAAEDANDDQQPATPGDIARILREMDTTMLATVTDTGCIASRPMSNNRDVDYDGTSWFFTLKSKRIGRDVAANPAVTLNYAGDGQWVSVQGSAELLDDRSLLEEHYVKDVDDWFEGGLDNPDLALVKVTARHVSAWGRVSGEIAYSDDGIAAAPRVD